MALIPIVRFSGIGMISKTTTKLVEVLTNLKQIEM